MAKQALISISLLVLVLGAFVSLPHPPHAAVLPPAPAVVTINTHGAFFNVGDTVTISVAIQRRPENRELVIVWGHDGLEMGSTHVTLEGDKTDAVFHRKIRQVEEGEWVVMAQLRALDGVSRVRAEFSVR